jgi:hypothetical protein
VKVKKQLVVLFAAKGRMDKLITGRSKTITGPSGYLIVGVFPKIFGHSIYSPPLLLGIGLVMNNGKLAEAGLPDVSSLSPLAPVLAY